MLLLGLAVSSFLSLLEKMLKEDRPAGVLFPETNGSTQDKGILPLTFRDEVYCRRSFGTGHFCFVEVGES